VFFMGVGDCGGFDVTLISAVKWAECSGNL
jgi:hypothetical protein